MSIESINKEKLMKIIDMGYDDVGTIIKQKNKPSMNPNINKNHTPNFENHNPTRQIKFTKLTKFVNHAVGLKKAVGIKKQFGVAKMIHTANVKERPPKQMSQTLKTRMNIYFEKDIQLLSGLMKKNLSDWGNQ